MRMSFFVSFEGIDGCGKTTQIRLLEAYLTSQGFQVMVTREPGGTEISESIRQILLHSKNTQLLPMSELLLYYASRHQNLFQKIIPALESGCWVLSDRYADASTAYQGHGRGIDLSLIDYLNQTVIGRRMPDLTILIDIDPVTGLIRAIDRNTQAHLDEGRFEKESLEFFQRVRQGYLNIAETDPQRVRVLDGNRNIELIQSDIVELVDSLIDKKKISDK
jgi:dTMP kinase